MITIEVWTSNRSLTWTAPTSAVATAIVREMIDAVNDLPNPYLWLRVTGGPTAAASRRLVNEKETA